MRAGERAESEPPPTDSSCPAGSRSAPSESDVHLKDRSDHLCIMITTSATNDPRNHKNYGDVMIVVVVTVTIGIAISQVEGI